MSQTTHKNTSRREFLKTGGKLAAASALAGVAIPRIHAADSQTVKVALVGCGGRGTGAAGNALGTKGGPIKMVAMADVFENKLKNSFSTLRSNFASKMDVP
jgi:hypothetical protein